MRIAAWPELSVERIALEEGLFFQGASVLQLHFVVSAVGECALLDRESAATPVNAAELWLIPANCVAQWRVGIGLHRMVLALPPELSERTLHALQPLCAFASVSRAESSTPELAIADVQREIAAMAELVDEAPQAASASPIDAQNLEQAGHETERRIHLSEAYFFESPGSERAQRVPLRIMDAVLPHFAEIAHAQQANDLESRFHLAFAHALLAHLLNRASALQPKPAGEEASQETAQIAQLRSFVDERLGYDLGVEDLARHTKISKFQLLRLMKKHLAQTPQQFVIQRRIDKAKQLLRGSGASLADIAFQTGFSSQSHLSNTFKQMVGNTPKGYRDGVA